MFDMTIHLGDVITAGVFLVGFGRYTLVIRDKLRAHEQTLYGSKEPPVVGLVERVQKLEQR